MHTPLTFDGMHFVARPKFEHRTRYQEAGFRYDELEKTWYTPNPSVAALLRDQCDDEAKKELSRLLITISPWEAPLLYPPNGMRPLSFQRDVALFALSRNRSYLGCAAGTGKTIMASLVMNSLHEQNRNYRFVYICPTFLVENVRAELKVWAPMMDVEDFDQPRLFGNFLFLPAGLLPFRNEMQKELKWFLGNNPSQLIVDEAHLFKNSESERTRRLYGYKNDRGLVNLFDRVTLMSGDPMPNRPIELYPTLSRLAPECIDFMTEEKFGMKYCAGRYDGFGYNFSGASNIRELGKRMEPFMIRVRKEVLGLPPLTEELHIVSEKMPNELMAFEHQLLRDYSPEDLMKERLEKEYKVANLHLMTYQRLLGLKKVPHALELIEHILQSGSESMLVYADNKEVVQALKEAFAKKFIPHITITGDVPAKQRYDLVKKFQAAKGIRVLLGNLRAMGLGYNITKATRVVNIQPHWTPTTNNQGTDRAHRIGQKNSVHVQYVIYRESVDQKVLGVILRKRKLQTYI